MLEDLLGLEAEGCFLFLVLAAVTDMTGFLIVSISLSMLLLSSQKKFMALLAGGVMEV